MALKSLNDLPPYGFFVYVAETGWQSTQYVGIEQCTAELQRHRQANPRFGWATDAASCRQFILEYTEARLRAMPGGEQWLMTDSPPGPAIPFLSSRRQAQAEGRAAAGAEPGIMKKAAAGIGTVLAWLGDGLKPVDQEMANGRAAICATCDRNQRLEGMERALGTAGDILHSIVEAKQEMKLATPHDPKLHQCKACLCVLTTKVWAPAAHVRKGITPAIEKELSPQCWIRPLLADSH